MNEKLKRHIQDTIDTLNLSESQAEYLKNCMMMAYHFGERDQLIEDYENNKKIISGIK